MFGYVGREWVASFDSRQSALALGTYLEGDVGGRVRGGAGRDGLAKGINETQLVPFGGAGRSGRKTGEAEVGGASG